MSNALMQDLRSIPGPAEVPPQKTEAVASVALSVVSDATGNCTTSVKEQGQREIYTLENLGKAEEFSAWFEAHRLRRGNNQCRRGPYEPRNKSATHEGLVAARAAALKRYKERLAEKEARMQSGTMPVRRTSPSAPRGKYKPRIKPTTEQARENYRNAALRRHAQRSEDEAKRTQACVEHQTSWMQRAARFATAKFAAARGFLRKQKTP